MNKLKRDTLLDLKPSKRDYEEDPWSNAQRDELLHLYLSGLSTNEMSRRLQRTKQAVSSQLWKLATNYRNLHYKPSDKRKSRSGKSFSSRELHIMELARKAKAKPAYVAKILKRSIPEIKTEVKKVKAAAKKRKGFLDLEKKTVLEVRDFRDYSIHEDMVLANRYLYYVEKTPVLSDQSYDALEKEVREFCKCPLDSDVFKPGSDKREDYPDHIRALGLYLIFKYAKKK